LGDFLPECRPAAGTVFSAFRLYIFSYSPEIYFMEKAKEIIEVLNDLVMIHNDRIAGYESAGKELKGDDQDLRSLFDHLIIEIRPGPGDTGIARGCGKRDFRTG
jgi:hypothetical protein